MNGIPAKQRILLVDDDEVFREATAAVLRSAGYEVRPAPDFRLALEILESGEAIDLFLVDIVMPDRVNGLALARMARLRRPDIKIMYVPARIFRASRPKRSARLFGSRWPTSRFSLGSPLSWGDDEAG